MQCYGSGSGISSYSGSRVLMTKNWKIQLKFYFLLSKIAIYLSLSLHKGRPNYRRSLQPFKENIRYFKKWNSITYFYFWVIFALLYSDLDFDLQHCQHVRYRYRYLYCDKLEKTEKLCFSVFWDICVSLSVWVLHCFADFWIQIQCIWIRI